MSCVGTYSRTEPLSLLELRVHDVAFCIRWFDVMCDLLKEEFISSPLQSVRSDGEGRKRVSSFGYFILVGE